MYRLGAESYSDSRNETPQRNGQEEKSLNRSYNGGTSSSPTNNASASGSKAVLAALRALQDKIRRLESERAQALDDTVQLRHQLKTQEIESEHTKQRDNLASQKSLHEIRSAYERLLSEKTEVEIRLSKLEDRNRDEQQIADDLRTKILRIEDEKHDGLLGIKDLEGARSQIQEQLQLSQQKEKDLGQTILWETKRHEGDMDIFGAKFRTLQNDLSAAVHDKNVLEIKLVELDQLVGQLLSVNESLVERLSGKPLVKAPTQSSKTTMIKKKKVPVQHSSRATVPTQTPSISTTSTTFDDVKNLHGMHKMYVNLAHSITEPLLPSTLKKGRRASTGGAVTGKVLNSSTLIRSKKNQSQDDHVNYNDESSTTNVSVRIPSTFLDNRFTVDESMIDGQFSNTSHSGNFGTTRHVNNSDLQGLITSLEEEFNMLDIDYRHLLEQAQAQPSTAESSLANDLVAVIQKLHRKGEQLRALKSPNRR